MRSKTIRIRVDPGFHRRMKIQAAENDCSIIKFSKKLAQLDDPFSIFQKNNKKGGNNGFYL